MSDDLGGFVVAYRIKVFLLEHVEWTEEWIFTRVVAFVDTETRCLVVATR